MADSGQEKTEEATPKRLREARKKGQVPKSRDVSTILVLIALFALMAGGMSYAINQLTDLMNLSFQQTRTVGAIDGGELMNLGKACFLTFWKIIGPLALAGAIVAALAGYLQVGSIFALDPLKPQFKKLNALEGIKNMFKTQTFIELGKNIVKIIIVFYLAYSTVRDQIKIILATAMTPSFQETGTNISQGSGGSGTQLSAVGLYKALPIYSVASIAADIIFRFIIKVLLAFLFISLIDFMIQRKQFMKQMRMTKDEVKREYKQDEGDPHIKGHRKQLHREFAFGDAKQAVKQSDVVVTNPTHVAVAIKYDRDSMVAPEIMIKGQRKFAEMIKSIAEENEIPIMRNIPLAWALFELEEGAEIPEELYSAVAEVLAYVFRMHQMKDQAGHRNDQINYV